MNQENKCSCALNEFSFQDSTLFKFNEFEEYVENHKNPLEFLDVIIFNETFKKTFNQEQMSITRVDSDDSSCTTSRSVKKNHWTSKEDNLLKEYHDTFPTNWKIKASLIFHKTKRQCAYRYNHLYGHSSLGNAIFRRFDDVHLYNLLCEKSESLESAHKKLPQFTIEQLKKRFLFYLLPKAIKTIKGNFYKKNEEKNKEQPYYIIGNLTEDQEQSLNKKVKEITATSLKIKDLYTIIYKDNLKYIKKCNNNITRSLIQQLSQKENYLLYQLTKKEKALCKITLCNINDAIEINSIQKNLLFIAKLNLLFNRIINE